MRTKRILAGMLLALLLGFIWIHSMLPRETSSQESSWVADLLRPFLELFVGQGNVTNHLVRKLAHFAEYGALGVMLYVNIALYLPKGWRRPVLAVNLGLYTALIDETIQIFSGRGPQIRDVWLDLAGAVTGILMALLLGVMLQMRKEKRKK